MLVQPILKANEPVRTTDTVRGFADFFPFLVEAPCPAFTSAVVVLSAPASLPTSAVDGSAVDASAVDASAVDASAVDASAVDASAVDASVVDASAVDKSAVDEPVLARMPSYTRSVKAGFGHRSFHPSRKMGQNFFVSPFFPLIFKYSVAWLFSHVH
jgi:hypothetical protein